MERLFVECAVRAALLVAGTAIVLLAMKVRAAATRHSAWTGVVALMLALPIWTAWGPKASLRLLPPLAQVHANEAISPAAALPRAFRASPLVSIWQAVLLGVYLSGLCLLLFRLAIGTICARRLVRHAVLQDNIRTSSLCASPVTVGFVHPVVILPEHWRRWSPAQLDIVLTHEGEHARRRDSLVQWLALLNRALFWFHPAAWWLERNLSALAEEACDDVVLARGYDAREYAEYLVDIARSVTRSGARLNVVGMAMPGGVLPQRIQKIMEGRQAPRFSATRMACVAVACAITGTVFAAGTLDHGRRNSSAPLTTAQHGPASVAHPAAKFVLSDLKIVGDVHDRDGIRDRILTAWKDREYGDGTELVDEVMEVGIRRDFQKRGYFKVVAQDPVSRPLGLSDGKQRILIIASVTEGDQFRLGTITIIQNVATDSTLTIPVATLRDQFLLRNGDLFNVTEIQAGLERLKQLYGTHGYADATAEPDMELDNGSHRINVILRITEGQHTL
jgi:beta-lactamase regulating signal transducer with metallopeptidase domain